MSVALSHVKILDLEEMQDIDLENIEETGQSVNLFEAPNYSYFKLVQWRPVPPSKSLYELALEGIQVRKEIIA